MKEVTTIQIRKSTSRRLKEVKRYERETYDEVISHLIETYRNLEITNQYDEFLHKVQQRKMKDLWDNKEDEEWENV